MLPIVAFLIGFNLLLASIVQPAARPGICLRGTLALGVTAAVYLAQTPDADVFDTFYSRVMTPGDVYDTFHAASLLQPASADEKDAIHHATAQSAFVGDNEAHQAHQAHNAHAHAAAQSSAFVGGAQVYITYATPAPAQASAYVGNDSGAHAIHHATAQSALVGDDEAHQAHQAHQAHAAAQSSAFVGSNKEACLLHATHPAVTLLHVTHHATMQSSAFVGDDEGEARPLHATHHAAASAFVGNKRAHNAHATHHPAALSSAFVGDDEAHAKPAAAFVGDDEAHAKPAAAFVGDDEVHATHASAFVGNDEVRAFASAFVRNDRAHATHAMHAATAHAAHIAPASASSVGNNEPHATHVMLAPTFVAVAPATPTLVAATLAPTDLGTVAPAASPRSATPVTQPSNDRAQSFASTLLLLQLSVAVVVGVLIGAVLTNVRSKRALKAEQQKQLSVAVVVGVLIGAVLTNVRSERALKAEQQKREGLLQAQLLSSEEKQRHALLAAHAAHAEEKQDWRAEMKDLLKDKKRYEAYEKEADRVVQQTRKDAKAKIAKSEAARRAAAQADQADLESERLLHAEQREAVFKLLDEARRERNSALEKAKKLKDELEARDQDDYK